MTKDPLVYIMHIRDAVKDIEEFLKGLDRKTFFGDRKTQNAVVRSLTIIGEAARNTPVEFKKKYADVDWKGAIGTRDVIVHDYFEIDFYKVWDIIEKDLPVLKSQINGILVKENVGQD